MFLQEAEIKARNMEEEIYRLRKSLDERNGQLQATASNAEKVKSRRIMYEYVTGLFEILIAFSTELCRKAGLFCLYPLELFVQRTARSSEFGVLVFRTHFLVCLI